MGPEEGIINDKRRKIILETVSGWDVSTHIEKNGHLKITIVRSDRLVSDTDVKQVLCKIIEPGKTHHL